VVKEEESAVEIDVLILEMNEGATKNLGITWPGSVAGYANPPAQYMTNKIIDIMENVRFFRDFQWKLDALIQEGDARLLSRPRLACQSGKEAELLVGGEKPIFTTEVVSTTGTSGTNVEYKEYGIRLKMKPIITENDRVKLMLDIQVSEPGTAEYIGQNTNRTAQAYPFTKRNISTEVFVNDGQTFAIGGLIKKKTEEDLRRMPWLSDVPVLGIFFRNRTTTIGSGHGTKGDTELFITITPKIVAQLQEGLTKVEAQELENQAQNTPPLVVGNLLEFIPRYSAIVQKRIIENLIYPNSAKEAGFQGSAVLSLHVAHTGELLEAKIKDSSGYKVLDENALTVAGLILYPPFPAYVEQEELWIDVPVTYRLR
jgi:TonB family protein